ncbi:MAG: response regulator [Methanolinea sp.]|jgi:twitching motility two-component system response regulator PilH|nr:response regulator [Methanolinea sp.]
MTRVLIIDDSAFQRKILSTTLAAEGCEVIEARNGREGLETGIREHPDIIILDLLMPEMDGFSFLKEWKGKGLSTPVFVFTSDIQTATRTMCLDLGATGFLNKPLKKDELVNILLSFLGK